MDPVWLKSYPVAVDPAPGIPDEPLAGLIRRCLESYAAAEAYWSMGTSLTYGEVHAKARAFAAWLRAAGVAPGDRVAIMLPNVLAFPVVTFGTLLAGGVVTNVNPLYTARELALQLGDSGARVLVAWAPSAAVVDEAAAACAIGRIVGVAPDALLAGTAAPAAVRPGWTPLETALALGERAPPAEFLGHAARPAFLQYTGGTTGISKGAVLTEGNVVAACTQMLAWTAPFLPPECGPYRAIIALPLYHIAALVGGLVRQMLRGGACILIANPRDLDGFVETLRTQRFHLIGGVNTLYAALLAHPRIGEVDFSSCRLAQAGATATSQAVVDRWQALTGRSIVEGYGMTETCCYISQLPIDGRPFNGTVGLPLPLTELSIRDVEGRELPVGAEGEICVRGPQVMAGYWNRPEETAKAFTGDGFLRSGDIGSIDADGYLRISDRKKDMILVSGFNVYPNEIEGVLIAHPKVLEAAVVAAADGHSGEVPVAFVVRRDASLTEDELAAHCARQLAAYKRPRRYEFRDTLPKTPVGKILRRALRDEIAHAAR